MIPWIHTNLLETASGSVLHRRDQQTDTQTDIRTDRPRNVKTSAAMGRIYAMHAMRPEHLIITDMRQAYRL